MASSFLAQVVTYSFPTADPPSYRVFDDTYGALAPHPCPHGRMALVAGVPPGAPGCGGLYLSSTQAGAIWETVLNGLLPNASGQLLVSTRDRLARRSIVEIRVLRPLQLVDLRLPARLALLARFSTAQVKVAQDLWHAVLEEDDHEFSHVAAAEIRDEARASNTPYAGVTWQSARDQSAQVHLLYAPPLQREDLDVAGTPLPLASSAGLQLVRDTATAAHMQAVIVP